MNTSVPEDEAKYPVRVLKDAISDGVPYKDLLITPEHCILLDGQFIPVRMLVNGATIFYDTSITEYTYYHIETEAHSVIVADGVMTESYLDTGNRSNFIYDHNLVSIVNKKKEWNKDSAAPLVTATVIVEPIFKQLTVRAQMLGVQDTRPALVTTKESGLYLIADTGEILDKTLENNNRFIFKIPPQITSVRVMSRTSKPSQVIGPFVDDRRDLGVLVGEVTLLEKNKTHSITDHFTSSDLQGWDVQEQSPCRWTNGNAVLTLKKQPSDEVGMLVINVLAKGPYLVEEHEMLQQAIA